MKLMPADGGEWLRALMRIGAVLGGLGGSILGAAWWITGAPGASFRGPLPPATAPELETAARLRADVEALAGRIGMRSVEQPNALRRAEDHVKGGLEAAGYTVRRHAYRAGGQEVANVEAVKPGTSRPEEVIVVGAHYDSVPDSPGADDNASGTAALLELGRRLAERPLARTVRFVGFVNEEPPFFKEAGMGSLVYARACRAAGDRVVAMFSLEMLGYYDTGRKSQSYPPPLGLFYPDTGDFVAFVGDFGARDLVRRSVALFREKARFPSEALAGPAFIQGVDFSDHWSFRQVDYPALMVTDTAFMRNAHYHQPTDTPERLDYERMARVTLGLVEVVAALASQD